MHRDKKVGLAMGILLVGIVAAFFFRNETDPLEDIPPLEDALALDEQIATQSGGPYLTGLEPVDERYRDSGSIPSTDALPSENTSNQVSSRMATPDPLDTLAPVNRIEPIADSATSKIDVPVGMPFEPVTVESTNVFTNDLDWDTVPDFKPTAPDPPPLANASQSRKVPTNSIPIETVEPPRESELVDSKTDPPVRLAPEPRSYRIRPGDTLSEIAWRELGSSRRYHELYEANRDRLRSPDDLPIGMELRIPNGKPTTKEPQSARKDIQTPRVERTSSRRFIPIHQSPIR